MIRLRCPLQPLLLLLAASVAAWSDFQERQDCGILKFCMVHSSCFTLQNKPEGWIIFKNMGNYSNYIAPAGYDDKVPCERFITIRPQLGGEEATIRMVDNKLIKTKGMNLYFERKKYNNADSPHLSCKNNAITLEEKLKDHSFKTNNEKGDEGSTVNCKFDLIATDHKDIRIKISEFAREKFEIMPVDQTDADNNQIIYKVSNVNLRSIRMPCKDKVKVLDQQQQLLEVHLLAPLDSANSANDGDNGDELPPNPHVDLYPPNPNWKRDSDIKRWVDEEAKVQCPIDFPMHHRKSGNDELWKPVEDGLKCRQGYLTHDKDESKRVEDGDMVKCARKKCSLCEKPASLKGEHTDAPIFDDASDGTRCRSLTCQSNFMILKEKGEPSAVIHKYSTLNCSATDESRTKNYWEKWNGLPYGELTEARCTKDVSCTEIHPLNKGVCEKGNKNCMEVFLTDNYKESFPCEADFDLLYTDSSNGNETRLSSDLFKCDKQEGRWEAWDLYKGKVEILDNSTLICTRKKRSVEPPPKEAEPFVGSVPFYVFTGGVVLVLVAVIVVGTFYIVSVKQKKAAKKKPMAEVSLTFKEPPNYKKKKSKKSDKKSERKKRPERSVVKSLTGTNSGPDSQSGPTGSTPIAPPSTLLTPSKGISKPDKGCAVLDLTTGKSKNLKWTNHTGDGPPTQRQQESWAASDSKMDDVQSAIKFAPGELEAATRAAAYKQQRKEKSRQNSVEYNLGDPKTLKNDEWKKAKQQLGQVEESTNNVDESTTKK